MDLTRLVVDVPDHPRPGVVFKDITPLLADARAFAHAIDAMAAAAPASGIDLVAGIEARGFILGAALARRLQRGFVPLRRAGKLPGATVGVDYASDTGHGRLELRAGTVWAGAHVLVVDDVIATGATIGAAVQLIQKANAHPVAVSVLVELDFLDGRARLPRGFPVHRVLAY
jgi:adenine phosphoribosyltransferase